MADTATEVTEKTTAPATLTESITAATTEHTPATEETKAETKQEEKTEEKQEVVADGLTEVEQEQARQLFLALKNPEQAATVVAFLAQQAGYTKVETKQEAAEVKDDIVSVLKEKLGPDLDYLAEKLGPAIDKLVDDKLKANTADLRQKFEETEKEKLSGQVDVVMKELAKSQFSKDELPEDIVSEMNRLMDKIDPKADMTPKEYIEFLYYSVAGRKGIRAVDTAKDDKIKKNRTDASSRLASEGAKQPISGNDAAKFTTLHQAIAAAVEEVAAQEK